ncbi:Choline-sulfatase [Anaerohalosphaera lusitana]|uniref:Choline-sulfatase n=1 Tax=Anaerohalosphaera lusitana TaxID=1936003 RepID=A0A1U9NHQ2_9BACT|nr:sulfatase-like hydrolase/transferase [Anaerohalosphaera lusitana]AQT67449.1 Choline-sulfatase [Anaerohalosphaera lusitana]
MRITRRGFLRLCAVGGLSLCVSKAVGAEGALSRKGKRPNVILCMADDLGWGDVGYNGNDVVKTSNLDAMARAGVRFDRWYSASAVCSPTRGSCITGRNPERYGVHYANVGHMRKEELTIAEALKPLGYRTGHFGKWHLGTLTKEIKDSNRGGERGVKNYSPPWENGFDVCFSTEAKVPTYDPMRQPAGEHSNKWWNPVDKEQSKEYGTHYWTGADELVTENLEGDDSRVIMDRAVEFISASAKKDEPFVAVVWFHAPHLPVVASDEHRAIYEGLDGYSQNYFGCITAMDEQMGRLRKLLRELGIEEDTMLWFCSDNGPEGRKGQAPGSTGGLRGRKRSLYEGGIRVPGLLEWPARVKEAHAVKAPCCTSDYMPTVMDAVGGTVKKGPEPVDGVSLLDMINGKTDERGEPIAFEIRRQVALIGDRYKLYSRNEGEDYELYDILTDPSESEDITEKHPDAAQEMIAKLDKWRRSCAESLAGKDYK